MLQFFQTLSNRKLYLVAASLWSGFAWGQVAFSDDILVFDHDSARSKTLLQSMSIEIGEPVESELIIRSRHTPRGVLLWGIGNAYQYNRALGLGNAENNAILGLRYRFKSFVDLQFRAGFAYGFGLLQGKLYVGIRNSF